MLIAPGVEMLEISGFLMGETRTIYPTLLWDERDCILVDTGYPGQLDSFRQAFWQANLSFERLNRVILTHQDIDHIGGLNAMLIQAPVPLEVMAHVDEIPYIEGQKRPLKLEELQARRDLLPAEMKSFFERLSLAFQQAQSRVSTPLADGQTLPTCGGISVIHTPGHTLGHISLFHHASRTLIAGDALSVEDGILTRPAPYINFDTLQAIQSLRKLARFDIAAVICYHGGLYTQAPNERIAELAQE